jgi:organic radical activating enzyme
MVFAASGRLVDGFGKFIAFCALSFTIVRLPLHFTMNKADKKYGTALPVMEQFYTIQGEGVHSGKAAYFIRLAGCPVGCHWCDVKESWKPKPHQLMPLKEIALRAALSGAPITVITGGEPAMYDLSALTGALKKAGLKVHLETSGAFAIRGKFDWICVSPKKRKPPLKASLRRANELKVVVYNRDDLAWAEKNAALVTRKCRLLLQPEWGKKETVLPYIIEFVQKHPLWQISLQSHKYMGVE